MTTSVVCIPIVAIFAAIKGQASESRAFNSEVIASFRGVTVAETVIQFHF
ncbi:MAG: hypothetical protein AAGA88_04405 [Pseudomonadota bacterium]